MPISKNFSSLKKEAFQELLFSDNTILLDVRTSREQEIYGVIADSQIHIDISWKTAVDMINNLDKQKHYLIYCWHGVRSKQVMNYMKMLGFQKLHDLEGGIDIWN